MPSTQNQVFIIAGVALLIFLIYKLSPILTPFLLGGLLAYLVDPLVKRLERRRIPHILSVLIVFLFLIVCVILFFALLYPLVYRQIELLIRIWPSVIDWLQNVGMPWLLQHVNVDALKTSIKTSIPATLSKSGWVVSTFIHSSMAIIDILLTIILTPIVTFYLLKDWDQVISGIKHLLPKSKAPLLIAWAKNCDEVLSAFIRGQLLVMLCLALIYGIGLTIIGLNFGMIIGLLGGILSIAPFLGSIFILLTGLIGAIMQFGTTTAITAVIVVFLVANLIESYILTPYLVGDRIGLHPVAVIFCVMAGGVLFGFFGILLALPVSAILISSFRFFRRRLHYSPSK